MTLRVEVVDSLEHVTATEWDALVATSDPFIEHAFLSLLETSGCVGPNTGWLPRHVLVRDDQTLCGAAPMYFKTDSYGEYIFDWAWAQAAGQMGIPYYPKLVCAVPYTPVTGRRLLVNDDAVEGPIFEALVGGVLTAADALDASSVHILFATEQEYSALAKHPAFLPRLTYQFHWENRGYESFDDYLSQFRSGPRRQVRRERREAGAEGLTLSTQVGGDLSDNDWGAIHRFYQDTTGRKGAIPYLTPKFYQQLPTALGHRVLAGCAHDAASQLTAASLCFQKGDHLYGRYWGALADVPFVHFELCYYQLIERCIDEGWTRFEAGAQGMHKLKRGLMPALTYSAHAIRDPGLVRILAHYLARERNVTLDEVKYLSNHSPFRKNCRPELKLPST